MKHLIVSLKKDLANYLQGKYDRCMKDGVIRLPKHCALYYVVDELIAASPRRTFVRPEGNVVLEIPSLWDTKKKWVKYPVISRENLHILERRIEMEMRMELYELMKQERLRGTPYIKTLEAFMRKYNLSDLSEESFLRGFRRWRKRMSMR